MAPPGGEFRFMTLASDTTPVGRETIPAAIHPYDRTARPQVLDSDANRDYYELIAAFEARTGVGCLLNTSFNLHGEPIVATPEDALDTFGRSGLGHLALGRTLISKGNGARA